jgi:branched-chain amino acid transport system substrate-binding protein
MNATKCIFLSALLTGCVLTLTPASAQTTIGASAPMTGPRALLGKYFKQGVDLAVEEVNAAGGVLGKPLAVTLEDDQGDNPNAAINAMSRLKDADKVPVVVGPHFSVAQLAVQKSYCEGALVSITGASGVPVTATGCKFVFRIRGNDNIQAKAIVAYALQNLKIKKIGLISINDDFGKGGADRVIAELKSNGIEPASIESHNAHDTDFSAQLARLQRAGAELVVLWTHDSESALIVRQARQLGLNMKFAGSTSLSQPEFIQLAGPTGEGAISASDFVASNPDPMVQAFVKKYKAKYKDDPELYAATYYDSIKLAAQAINAAGSTDPQKVRDAFAKIEATGVLASYKCDEINDCNHQTIIVEIKNGQPSVLSTVKF